MTSQSSDLGIPGLKIANPAGMMSEDEQKSFSVLSNDVDDEDKQKESDNGVEDDSSGFSSLNGTPLVAITPDDMLE